MSNLDTFKKYFDNALLDGEVWFDDIKISSNSYYIFFTDMSTNKALGLFSKKYFMTVEFVKDTKKSSLLQRLKLKYFKKSEKLNFDIERLNKIAEIVEEFRKERNIVIGQFEFWLPHCLIDGKEIGTQLVAGSYGVNRELALEYLIQHDMVFKMLYDVETKTYMGLPLMSSYEEAQEYPLGENKKYLLEYRRLNKFLEK